MSHNFGSDEPPWCEKPYLIVCRVFDQVKSHWTDISAKRQRFELGHSTANNVFQPSSLFKSSPSTNVKRWFTEPTEEALA